MAVPAFAIYSYICSHMNEALKRMTIFYTDDDPDDQLFFKEVVSEIEKDCAVYTQNHGQELLQLLKNPPPSPHLIFLDLNMPIKNGYDALREIRGSSDYQQTPVIIFSTSNDHQAISRSKELGANMFISKPPSYERLKEILQEVLSFNWVMPNPPDRQFFYTS